MYYRNFFLNHFILSLKIGIYVSAIKILELLQFMQKYFINYTFLKATLKD